MKNNKENSNNTKNKAVSASVNGSANFSRKQLLFLIQFALLLAIEAIFCFTPLGSIPIGPVVATLAMIPVIVTGITMGVGAGAAMGFFAGLFSFIVHSFVSPMPTSFMFTPLVNVIGTDHGNILSLIICFLPRILVGVLPPLFFGIYKKSLTKKIERIGAGKSQDEAPENERSLTEEAKKAKASRLNIAHSIAAYGLSGLLGSLINTAGVLGLFALFFGSYINGSAEALSVFGAKSVGSRSGSQFLQTEFPRPSFQQLPPTQSASR